VEGVVLGNLRRDSISGGSGIGGAKLKDCSLATSCTANITWPDLG
jgi:hypothetical protein